MGRINQEYLKISIILEGALDQEMDEELGYSKYDYRNKETDNSRNGHSFFEERLSRL